MALADPFSRVSPRIEKLRRLTEIMEERSDIARELAPYYEAARLLSYTGTIEDYGLLEDHPKFRPIWLRDRDLKDEWIRLQLELA